MTREEAHDVQTVVAWVLGLATDLDPAGPSAEEVVVAWARLDNAAARTLPDGPGSRTMREWHHDLRRRGLLPTGGAW